MQERENLQQLYKRMGSSNAFFTVLIDKTKHQLYAVIKKMVRDHHIADDVLQATYIKVFEKLNTYKGESSMETWVYRIAVNTTLDHLRKKKNRDDLKCSPPPTLADESPDYEGALNSVLEAMEGLPAKQKEVFAMRFFSDKSFKEMGALLGISEGGARSSYHHAQRKIKEVLIEKGWLS